MKIIDLPELDLGAWIGAGETIVVGEAAGEPLALTAALVAQRASLDRVEVFLGVGITATFTPEHTDHLRFRGIGAALRYRALARSGGLEILPQHFSDLPRLLTRGELRCDVVMLQLSPADAQGRYSYAVSCDYLPAAIRRARLVIAEINQLAPQSCCRQYLSAEDIDLAVFTQRPLPALPAAVPGELEQAMARHIDALIPDRATLQLGLGSLPEALTGMLASRRDLGVHSGMLSDSFVSLVEQGVITNAYKEIDPGVSITGTLIGSQRLYAHAHRNASLLLCPTDETHGAARLAQLTRLHSINSALEVDLTGQVNAEAIGSEYLGTIGGQSDYVRAAIHCSSGRSIIALPSSMGERSRIVAQLSGPVTTSRSDVDVIATEHGCAHLRGRSLRERAKALIAISAPQWRDRLQQQAKQQGLG
jgi:acyl-CoA hydrolase